MSRFAILVVSAFLLRGALESRETEMEIHLSPEGGSEVAADPAAAVKPESGSGEAADPAAAVNPESGSGEAADPAAAVEPESGSEEGEESAASDKSESESEEEEESAPAAVPCKFGKEHNPKVLKKMLERINRKLEINKKEAGGETLCTSMNISQDDKCCKSLQKLGKEVKGLIKSAKDREGASNKDWCDKVSQYAKWAVSNKGGRMHEPCTKHTDCVQEWWTNGMACGMGSSALAFKPECRLCPGSKQRPGICGKMTGRQKKECNLYQSCRDDSQCAYPSKCMGKKKKVCKKA